MRQPARLTWIGGCLIGGIILICCLLSLAAAAAGAYWVPIAKEEGSLSFLATETRRPSPTRRPTKTSQATPEVVVITEAPAPTKAPMPTVVVEEEPAGPVDMELWTTESGDSLILLQEIASSFNQQNPDITIQITNIGYSDFTPMLETVFAAGDPPDMILYAAPSMRKYVESGLLYPAGTLVDTNQFYPSLVDEVTMNGEVWGVPLSTTGQLVLFYNKDLVESPPQNSLQFIDTAKKHGLSYYHRVWFFDFPWLGAFSGSVRNGDSPIPQLNSNAMVQTLQFILDLTDKHGILPALTEYGQGDNEFLSGQTGMAINGSWSYTYYRDSLGDKLGVAPLPNMTTTGRSPSVLVYGLHFFVPNQQTGQNSLNAMSAFIQYATNYDNQIQLAQRLNYLPALQTTYGDPAILNNPMLTTMLMQLPNGTPEWIGMNWSCIYTAADPAIAAMLDGSITPEQAAEQMQAEVESCIANEQ